MRQAVEAFASHIFKQPDPVQVFVHIDGKRYTFELTWFHHRFTAMAKKALRNAGNTATAGPLQIKLIAAQDDKPRY